MDVGRRILVVDDNEDSADALAMVLSADGHEVATANDGLEALDMVPQFHPDVVILDIGLPEMDGYEVARRLRESYGHGILLLALTGYGQDDDRERAAVAGFDHHLLKPVDLGTLHQVMERPRPT